MTLFSHLRRAHACAAIAALAGMLVAAIPGAAATAVFPIGSRIGLVPPPGMTQSPNFEGFQDKTGSALIFLATLPGDAFKYLNQSMVPEALQKQGIDKREPITVGTETGFLLSGAQSTGPAPFHKWMLVAPAGDVTALVTIRAPNDDKALSDAAVRDILKTVVVRATVPDAERLMLVPFKVGDLAGFKIDEVLPGRALMLVHEAPDNQTAADAPSGHAADNQDAKNHAAENQAAANPAAPEKMALDDNKDVAGHAVDARLIIASLPGGPTDPKDNDEFARDLFARIEGIRDVHVQDAEPLRIAGQSGYQTLATAKDASGATDLMVVQWLRFGTGGYMQMVGIARTAIWPDMFMRLRSVRDGIVPR